LTKMTPKGARELAAFVRTVRLRSGGVEWHVSGIEDVLTRHRDMADEVDLAIAAIRAAAAPVNRTPGVIPLEGPHWRGLGVEQAVRFEPTPAALLCAHCSRRRDVCEQDPFAGHEYLPVKDQQPSDGGDARVRAREALEAGRASLCPHGHGLLCDECYPSGARTARPPVTTEKETTDAPT
jgi:hypothetical protein